MPVKGGIKKSKYGRTKKRYSKRKKTYKKTDYNIVQSVVGKDNKLGMPSPFRNKLVSVKFGNFTPGGGALTQTYYHLNSAYDPWASWTGDQAGGYDQMSTLYWRYKVHAVKFTAEIVSKFTTADVARVGMYANNVTASATNYHNAAEQKNFVGTFLGPNTSGVVKKLEIYAKIEDIMGEPINDTTYQALVTADPARLAILHFVYEDTA